MGIDANLTFHIARSTKMLGLSGAVCTLGVITEWSDADEIERAMRSAGLKPMAGSNLFVRMGYQSLESADVSEYEGCTHILDLNTQSLPEILAERYDVVYNGGTLEHVFDVRAALKNIFQMLRPGGVVIHFLPVNGWVDHGFYQFSPTFFVDYYIENGFELLDARLMNYEASGAQVTVHPYVPGALDAIRTGSFRGNWLCYCVARKIDRSTWDRIPLQGRYADLHDREKKPEAASLTYFMPYRSVNGAIHEIPLTRVVLSDFQRGDGFELVAHLPGFAALADNIEGQVSPLMLLEDGEFIGPPHALHEQIRREGGGAYSHWGEWLQFSTSDNGPAEGRVYECVVPDEALQYTTAHQMVLVEAERPAPIHGGVMARLRSLARK